MRKMLPQNKTPESGEKTDDREIGVSEGEINEGTPTKVPNAHASGLGAMGRNDEKLPTSPDDAEDRPEPAY